MNRFALWTALAASLLFVAPAGAVRQPRHLIGHSGLEVAAGQPTPRARRVLSSQAPAARRRSAVGLLDDGWTAMWDKDTGAPVRIYGGAIDAPGSVADPEAAASAARDFLASHIDLLAPGASASDFELIANVELRGLRTVTFQQRHQGLEVLGGRVGFRFKNDHLFVIAGEALPYVSISSTRAPAAGTARQKAVDWVDADFGTAGRATDVASPVIVPIVSGPGKVSYRVAVPVTVETSHPIGRWVVYVGADKGAVARQNLLHFASGTVLYNAPERWPGADRSDFPAVSTSHLVGGISQLSDAAGVVTFGGASTTVGTGLSGSFITIANQAGAAATTTLNLDDGGTATWNDANTELVDAQINAYIHAALAKEAARAIGTVIEPFLDSQMTVNVNIDMACNAFADGNTLNFFQSGSIGSINCANTGRLVDVVYHEFGHNLDLQTKDVTGAQFDSSLSEGIGDYFAATITGDPQMGPGFVGTPEPLRPLEGPDGDLFFPQGFVGSRDPHTNGVVFSGSMWDLRQALVAEMGEAAGKTYADQLFYGAVQRASDITTAYTEVLAEDDDNGNLGDGTPNKCLIDFAFGTHGLGDARSLLGPGLETPVRDRYDIVVPVRTPGSGECAAPDVSGIDLTWRLRGDDSPGETIAMELSGNEWRGTIPTQNEGTVIEYQVTVQYADGNTRRLPLNMGEPFYEFFNGDVEPLYCTDFESDPFSDGWTTATAAGINDWEWGAPAGGPENFDPPEAFSGSNVLGTALTADGGIYSASSSSSVTSPSIDTPDSQGIHIQYHRWLGTEDGAFDQTKIYANNVEVFSNKTRGFPFTTFAQADHEWRFHDIDVSDQAFAGSVSATFEITSDTKGIGAGWNIDDFCIVKFVPSVCGDGSVTGNENCDDGEANSDTDANACRTTCQPAFCGDGVTDDGEQCDDGNDIDDDNCSNSCIGDDGGGCGCEAGSRGGSGTAVLFLLLLAGYLVRRRRVRG